MQDRTVHYSTIKYNTISHITQNNIQHSTQPLIRKITKEIHEHTLYTLETQKRAEPKVDEPVCEIA